MEPDFSDPTPLQSIPNYPVSMTFGGKPAGAPRGSGEPWMMLKPHGMRALARGRGCAPTRGTTSPSLAYYVKPGRVLDDWSPEQRFSLTHARTWRRNTRPEALVNLIRANPHSPGEFRVSGRLADLEEFARAFGCRVGDAMVNPPKKRTRIW